VSSGTRRVYSTYWTRILEVWGSRRVDEPTALEIRQLAETIKAHAVSRRNSRGGRTAAEHLIAALRCVYRFAVADGLIAEADDPARKVAKPRRLASTRHALAEARLAEICEVAAGTGNDPALDSLLLRLHTETACRRGGALALRASDLDVEQCLVRLREKGETMRWQPVSPTLIHHLCSHHEERGNGRRNEQLLRYRNGNPITRRRYDYLWLRLGRHLPWVATQGVSTHWLRHTTLTWVERHFGYAVARAYAGHDGRNDAGTTATYVRADLHEVAVALAALAGEDHPLAVPGRHFSSADPRTAA
jgi:site-specific recombinase XerD